LIGIPQLTEDVGDWLDLGVVSVVAVPYLKAATQCDTRRGSTGVIDAGTSCGRTRAAPSGSHTQRSATKSPKNRTEKPISRSAVMMSSDRPQTP
jgi:hypothetical protein